MKKYNIFFRTTLLLLQIWRIPGALVVPVLFFILPLTAFGAAYNATDIIGQSTSGSNSYTESYKLNSLSAYDPYGVALDTVHHRLFVSDLYYSRILVYLLDSNNQKLSNNADFVIGQTNLAGSGHSATQSTMYYPLGLQYDSTNNRLFAVDHNNSRVLIYDTSSISNGMNASYVIGQANFTSGGNSTTQSTLKYPYNVALDISGSRMFVTDTNNNRVLVFDISTLSNGLAASYVIGQANFTSSTAATTQSGLNVPIGVGYDSNNNRLFVSDQSNRVLVYDASSISNGMNASYVIGQANFTSSTAATTQSGLSGHANIEYDETRDLLLVSDSGNARVLIYDASSISNGMNASYVIGQANFTSSTATATSTGFSSPAGISYDNSSKNLVVGDFGYSKTNFYDLTSLSNNIAYTDSVLIDKSKGFINPLGSALDTTNHRLYVLDRGERVLVFNLDSSNNLTDKTADYVIGQSYFETTTYSTTQNTMNYPWGIAVDSSGQRLFVSDYYGYRVLVFDTSVISNGMNASYVIGQTNFTSSSYGVTQSKFYGPAGLAYDGTHDRLFVTDYGASRVLVFDTSTISNGMNASYVLGQANFTSSSSATTQSTLNYPYSAAYDSVNDRLFVGDSSNNRVVVFDTSSISNGMNASYVLGQANFTSSSSATTQSTLSYPQAVEVDTSNNRLFVADGGNSRVLIYDLDVLANGMSAIAVLGQADFTSSSGVVSQSGLSSYTGEIAMSYDSVNNRLYLPDTYANRVLIYDFATISTSSSLASGTVGASYSQNLATANSQGTIAYNLVSGSLPSGLSLNSSTGVIDGTPSASGTSTLSIIATDTLSVGDFVSPVKSFTISINAPSGGGLPPEAFAPIQTPETGFQVKINNGANFTSSNQVVLSFVVGPDTKQMAISNQPDMKDAAIEPYSSTKNWTLLRLSGLNTVYVKFYNSWGHSSSVVSSSIYLDFGGTNQNNLPGRHVVGTNILFEDGSVWMLMPNNCRRAYTSEAAFLSYGFNSFSSVKKASNEDYALAVCDEEFIPPKEGSLVISDRGPDKGTVYLISGGKKHGFVSENVLFGQGYKYGKHVRVGDVSWISDGSIIGETNTAHLPGTIINNNGTIQYVGDTGLLGFPSVKIFSSWGYDFAQAVLANPADLKKMQVSIISERLPGILNIEN